MSSGGDDELRRLLDERAAIRRQLELMSSKATGLREELRKVRDGLDEESERYGALKESASKLRDERSTVLEELRDLRGRFYDMKKILHGIHTSLDRAKAEELEAEISKLEWDLQTKPRDEVDERRIMGSLGRLAKELESWKKAYSVRSEMDSLEKRLEGLGERYYELKTELESVSEELEGSREKVKSLLTAKKQIIQDLVGMKEDIKELQDRLIQVDAKLNALRSKQRQEAERRRAELTASALKKKRDEAMRKLERNEPLSWDDMQALYSGGAGDA